MFLQRHVQPISPDLSRHFQARPKDLRQKKRVLYIFRASAFGGKIGQPKTQNQTHLEAAENNNKLNRHYQINHDIKNMVLLLDRLAIPFLNVKGCKKTLVMFFLVYFGFKQMTRLHISCQLYIFS